MTTLRDLFLIHRLDCLPYTLYRNVGFLLPRWADLAHVIVGSTGKLKASTSPPAADDAADASPNTSFHSLILSFIPILGRQISSVQSIVLYLMCAR